MNEKAFPLSDVLRWASSITGKSVHEDREGLIDIIRESLEALINEESTDNLRRICIPSCGCLVTIPKEYGKPVKYKIGDKVDQTKEISYEFVGYERRDCLGYKADFIHKGKYPTYFDLPPQGGRVAARSLDYFANPNVKPYLIIQGKDIHGREVYSSEEGVTDIGERIYISNRDKSPLYSKTIFKEITSIRVVGAELNVQLVWCNSHNYGESPFEFGLLSYFDPGDEYPSFRRYEIPGMGNDCCYNVEVLCYLGMPALKYDNELIRGFDSGVISNMIRANYYKNNKNDINAATFNSSLAVSSIRKSNERENANSEVFNIFAPTSAANFPKVY